MKPRILLIYLGLFLALLGAYLGLSRYQDRKKDAETTAKKIFQVNAGDISEFALKKPGEEIRLARKDGEWFLTAPLKTRADQDAVHSFLSTLASMHKERELEGVEDLKPYGLDKPILVVEFTAQEQTRRLAIGPNTPGELNCYAYKDQDTRRLLVLNVAHKGALERPLAAFRDKTVFTFTPEKAKSLSLKTANTSALLEKQASGRWRWVGRDKFPVRGDKVEELLRFIHSVKVKEFISDAPKDLAGYGLAPPQGEVAVLQEKEPERLLLGKSLNLEGYGRKPPNGPVVLLTRDLAGYCGKALIGLEDRRLWRGEVAEVHKAVWGPPDKTWVAVKEKDFVKITGPDKQELNLPAVRLEVSLFKLQQLELISQAPPKDPKAKPGQPKAPKGKQPAKAKAPEAKPAQPKAGGKPVFVLELQDAAGKTLFRLEELSPPDGKEKDVLVRVTAAGQTAMGLLSRKAYLAWQNEMARLAAPPPAKEGAPPAQKDR